eukprot:475358-Prorocentrum_minimum.AAC.4
MSIEVLICVELARPLQTLDIEADHKDSYEVNAALLAALKKRLKLREDVELKSMCSYTFAHWALPPPSGDVHIVRKSLDARKAKGSIRWSYVVDVDLSSLPKKALRKVPLQEGQHPSYAFNMIPLMRSDFWSVGSN